MNELIQVINDTQKEALEKIFYYKKHKMKLMNPEHAYKMYASMGIAEFIKILKEQFKDLFKGE